MSDMELFRKVAPIQVVHEIAIRWQHLPHINVGHYELQALFFLLDHYIRRYDEPHRTHIMTRLMEISNYYEKGMKLKYRSYYSLTSIPTFAVALLCVMNCPRLTLLFKKPDDTGYRSATNDIRTSRGFDNIVHSNLFPDEEKEDIAYHVSQLYLVTITLSVTQTCNWYNIFIFSRYRKKKDPNCIVPRSTIVPYKEQGEKK